MLVGLTVEFVGRRIQAKSFHRKMGIPITQVARVRISYFSHILLFTYLLYGAFSSRCCLRCLSPDELWKNSYFGRKIQNMRRFALYSLWTMTNTIFRDSDELSACGAIIFWHSLQIRNKNCIANGQPKGLV